MHGKWKVLLFYNAGRDSGILIARSERITNLTIMKKLLRKILGFLGLRTSQRKSPAPPTDFIFVQIPEGLMPVERGRKYEDPLDALLKSAKVGEVSGGGSQLSAPDQDGKRTIEHIGLDVDLTDFNRGLPLLKAELIRLGVPPGTLLQYTRNGQKYSEPVS